MANRKSCVYNPSNFCYVCGKYVTSNSDKRLINLNNSYAKAYELYFGMKMGDQDKDWAPHYICHICRRKLDLWLEGHKASMNFAIPRIWREPQNHADDCFFLCYITTSSKEQN